MPGHRQTGSSVPRTQGEVRLSRGLALRSEAVQSLTQIPARADAELAEHLAQVPFDRPGGQEQLRADLRVGPPGHGEPGDGRFLRGEAGARLDRMPADRLAGRRQLAPGAFGE